MATYTKLQLKQMLDAFWFENSEGLIDGSAPNTWLKEFIDSVYIQKKIISDITNIAFTNVVISTLKAGDIIEGTTMQLGNMIFCSNQDDASENGIYIIGAEEGETIRNYDFPDAISCNGYLMVLNQNQTGVGNYFYVNCNSGDSITLGVDSNATERIINASIAEGDNTISFADFIDEYWIFIGHFVDADGVFSFFSPTDKTKNSFTANGFVTAGTLIGILKKVVAPIVYPPI